LVIHQRDGDTHVNKLAWQHIAALNLICTWKIAIAWLKAQIDLLLIFDDCVVITHADTLICLQWYALVLTLRIFYTLFGKNKITFGQKFFASPKVNTPVHLWLKVLVFYHQLLAFLLVYMAMHESLLKTSLEWFFSAFNFWCELFCLITRLWRQCWKKLKLTRFDHTVILVKLWPFSCAVRQGSCYSGSVVDLL